MNFSGSGIGWTLGPRGATIGIGKRGARLNTSFMGFSASEQLTKPQKHQPRLQQPGTTTFTLTCTVGDDGTLAFTDENGHLVPESTVALAKKQKREQLLALMQQKCDEINQTIDELGTIHLFTPKPNERPTFTPMEFGILRPLAPKPRKPSLMDRLFKKRLGRLEAANAQALAAFKEDLAAWQRKEDNFQAEMKARQEMILHGIYEDTEAMETWPVPKGPVAAFQANPKNLRANPNNHLVADQLRVMYDLATALGKCHTRKHRVAQLDSRGYLFLRHHCVTAATRVIRGCCTAASPFFQKSSERYSIEGVLSVIRARKSPR